MNNRCFPSWLDAERDRLFELASRGQLPHALLIHGIPGTGRRLLGLSIVGQLLGYEIEVGPATAPGALIDEETVPLHPDFALVQLPPDKRLIPVDAIRELLAFLSLTSHQSGHKVALINPADAMTEQAANALLKTLEEPPGSSVILLVTSSLSRLPATIVSRCHRVRVPVPSLEQAHEWLGTQRDGVDWTALLELAGGAPVRALEYRQADVPAQVAEFARDLDALERRRASPVGVAKRWHSRDPEVYLNWLYRRIGAEIRAHPGYHSAETTAMRGYGDLQNDSENLNMECVCNELRSIGKLKRLGGSGLNGELQLAGILARWYGRGSSG